MDFGYTHDPTTLVSVYTHEHNLYVHEHLYRTQMTTTDIHQFLKSENSTSATIFYLKTKGKGRGYIERQEITGADGMPTNFQIDIIDKTEDTD